MNIMVRVHEEQNVVLGFIEGEIDTFTAPVLREELQSIQLAEGLVVKLNLSKVSYMDSTGLGILVGYYKKVMAEQATLKLVGLTERLYRLFHITGLSELMDIETGEKVELTNESI